MGGSKGGGGEDARVVMRRLATILWHMLKYQQPYVIGPPRKKLPRGGIGVSGSARLDRVRPVRSAVARPQSLRWGEGRDGEGEGLREA